MEIEKQLETLNRSPQDWEEPSKSTGLELLVATWPAAGLSLQPRRAEKGGSWRAVGLQAFQAGGPEQWDRRTRGSCQGPAGAPDTAGWGLGKGRGQATGCLAGRRWSFQGEKVEGLCSERDEGIRFPPSRWCSRG